MLFGEHAGSEGWTGYDEEKRIRRVVDELSKSTSVQNVSLNRREQMT